MPSYRGEMREKAIEYLIQASQRAVQRSANVEAINHLTKGLEVLKTLPEAPERIQQELTLQITLGVPLTATKGYGAPETGKAYARARELCRQVGETPQLFPVLRGLWMFHLVRGVMSLSRLLQQQGKQEKARQMLAEIYDWFSEGFDTADLKQAKALLEALS
ncbi:MAG: hypothetical protein ACE5JP_08015 [Candidatus Bipolaricaulia bacterium]